MSITEEYKNQASWRNWKTYIDLLPIKANDRILDLGCSNGYVSKLLSQRAKQVTGIDYSHDLLEIAKKENKSDLKEIDELGLFKVDGIWSSFTVAYFPDFASVLKKWIDLLKPGGWIAIVEMDDLFAHEPITDKSQLKFNQFYQKQRSLDIYDFEMGRKIRDFITDEGLTIISEDSISDRELTCNGSVDNDIYMAWVDRFERMESLKKFLGDKEFCEIKDDFLSCLKNDKHESRTKIEYIIAKKNYA